MKETSRSLFRRSSILLGGPSTSNFSRFSARAIDALVILAVYFLGRALWLPLGTLAACCVAAFQDGMGAGQSVGKRIIGIRVIDDPTGVSCPFRSSLVRNIPFILSVLCATIPWLWPFFILVCLPLLILETYLLTALESGVRLGDVLANTLIVEYLEDPIATSL